MVMFGGGGIFYRSHDWHISPELVAVDMESARRFVKLTALQTTDWGHFGLVPPSIDVRHPSGPDASSLYLLIPFWLLFLGAAVPTLFAFFYDRRSRAKIPCPPCGYDLTSNVTGICPECGTPIPEEVRKEIAAK
jgi:hypothetical protein